MRTAVVAKVKDEALVRARRRQIVDAARSFRHSYSGLDAWHECTEGEQQ